MLYIYYTIENLTVTCDHGFFPTTFVMSKLSNYCIMSNMQNPICRDTDTYHCKMSNYFNLQMRLLRRAPWRLQGVSINKTGVHFRLRFRLICVLVSDLDTIFCFDPVCFFGQRTFRIKLYAAYVQLRLYCICHVSSIKFKFSLQKTEK